MSRQRLDDAQEGFDGGLNTVADESQLKTNEVRTARNARLTEERAAKKRYGTKRIHASVLGAEVHGGFGWVKAASSEEMVVANGRLYTGTHAIPATLTIRTGGLSTTEYPTFASFRDGSADVAYIADGGPINKWDGTTLSVNIASTPSIIRSICVYNQRLFGVSGDDENLYYSDLNNGDTLGTVDGGTAIVRTFSDQKLVAVASFRSSLFLFHASGISRFTGLGRDDIAIATGAQGITGDVGTLARRSVVAIENGILFLSDRGIYLADEGGVIPISVPIDVQFSSLSLTDLGKVCAVHNRSKREVWFSIPSQGTFVYNYRTQAWAGPWDGGFLTVLAMWETVDSNGRPIVLLGDTSSYVKQADIATVFKDDVHSDGTGGTAVTFSSQVHRMFCKTMSGEKSFRWAYLLADLQGSQNVTLTWNTLYTAGSYAIVGGGLTWGSGLWGSGVWGAAGASPVRVPIDGRGTYVDFTIEDNGSSAVPLFSRLEVEGFLMGRRGN